MASSESKNSKDIGEDDFGYHADEYAIKNAVFSDQDIVRQRSIGNIVIEPFIPKQLCNCSYDITLGENYFSSSDSASKFLNPWNQDSINKYWGKAKIASICQEDDEEKGLKKNDKYIILQPNELILGHTNEFIGSVCGSTTMMKGRSTMGRCGINICKDAGWGDIGYYNRFTMEICNSAKVPVILLVGEKIGQIIFISCGETNTPYYSKGRYQNYSSLIDLITNWKPEDMLPKAKMSK